MKKLKLDCEALAVDSFPTLREACEDVGTVHAREGKPTIPGVCDQTLLGTNPTCCPCTPRVDGL